ncbi:MAG: 7-cyano-7-deazaguanine synthase [Planctomycetes bacterium]|nr:7-cyano-7-deazaguanine synthase [Planctomycetota bacterium]
MPNERAILCGSAPASGNGQAAKSLQLRLDDEVHLTSDDLSRPVSANIPTTFADLIEIATYVYVADQAVTRGGDGVENVGADWRRRLLFTIPVRNLKFWRRADVMTALVETLSFLSEDEYHFEFVDLTKPRPIQHYLPFSKTGRPQAIEEVVLFSGGLDSLGGAVQEVVRDKRGIALVNHRPTEKLSRRYRRMQEMLAAKATEVGAPQPVHVPVHINKEKGLGREYTQRSRSFLYASIAATIAQAYELSRIRFYENGVVSLNLPLSPQVVGAKATRTTHPRVLEGFARILSLVADRPFAVENPYIWKTKSEIVKHIAEAGCGDFIKYSTSCTHPWKLTKFRTHCGTCSQCIDRRFAVLAAGAEALDPAEAYGVDLLLHARAEGESRTMLAAYVETASEVTKQSATEFFSRYGEVGRVVRHLDGSADMAALKIYELYQRHSKQVVKVVDEGIAAHATAIRNRELPDSCLLRLVCDTAIPLSVVSPTAAPAAPQEPQLALEDFVFRKKGQAWVVRHNGKQDFILLPSKGAAYLHLLLSSPRQFLSAVSMAFQVARVPQQFILGDAGERSDKEAQAAYRARYQELQEEQAQAEKDNDEATKNRVRQEMTSLADELKDRGWGGRPKKEHSDRDRVRKAVGIAIRRAVENIAKYDKELAEHFQPPRLCCGNSPVYDPDSDIDWDL